jgi:NAD(P)-dependent dehydrogenase (short-subunit alcohol dehydrogenase family)
LQEKVNIVIDDVNGIAALKLREGSALQLAMASCGYPKPVDMERMAGEVERSLHIDLLVNAVARIVSAELIYETKLSEWVLTLSVNLTGHLSAQKRLQT